MYDGSSLGWYLPISSITRPSRFLRESTTTMRYCGTRILPRRFKRILTATSVVFLRNSCVGEDRATGGEHRRPSLVGHCTAGERGRPCRTRRTSLPEVPPAAEIRPATVCPTTDHEGGRVRRWATATVLLALLALSAGCGFAHPAGTVRHRSRPWSGTSAYCWPLTGTPRLPFRWIVTGVRPPG